MRRELLTLGLTATVLLSLVAFTQPTAAVLTTISGPDDVTKPDPIVFESQVEIREDERIPIESFNLVITTDDGESVTVTFAPDGTVRSISPDEGVVGAGEIRIDQLRRSLEITPVATDADFGYGYQSGADERTGEERSFGYGYGYGYGEAQPTFQFRLSMDSKAFRHGDYTVQLTVNADGESGLFASNEQDFEVRLPSENRPGRDRAARDSLWGLPIDVDVDSDDDEAEEQGSQQRGGDRDRSARNGG